MKLTRKGCYSRLRKLAIGMYLIVWFNLLSGILFNSMFPRSAYFKRSERADNQFDYGYLINPAHLCSGEKRPSLVVLVLSTIDSFKKRDAIRNTWGSIARTKSWPSKNITISVAVVFLFGISGDVRKNIQLEGEAKRFGDVLQVGIVEAYGLNVTKKLLTGFKWTLEHCPTMTHLMKVDDDIFADIPSVLHRLETSECGSTLCGHKIYLPLTIRSGKYALSYEEYPYFFLPSYLFGYFYVMPKKVTDLLVTTAKYVPLLRMEDVYITGILPRVAHISTTAYRTIILDKDYEIDLCDFVTGRRDVNIGVNSELMYIVWETYVDPSICLN